MNLSRRLLDQGWQLCAVAPGAPLPSAEADWWPVGEAGTAAAALRRLQHWQLAGAPRAFDADDWCWRLRFERPPELADAAWTLGFDGLATLAEVSLNGIPVLASRSMFIRHEIEVGALLQPGANELLIRCHSLAAALAVRRPRPRWRAPMVEHAQLRWFRTTLLGRTPGWSPPVAPVGPWRDVWLQPRPVVDLRDLALRADLDGTTGQLALDAVLAMAPGRHCRSAVLVCAREGRQHRTTLQVNAGRLHGTLRIADVAPWWPHTHGEPALYDAWIEWALDGHPAPLRSSLGEVGFRRIELDRRDDGFALRINGQAIFCRGACWMPLDPVSLRATPSELQAAVRQVRDAGMNMLRLAGSLVYEEDAFYAACDAEGVLVWQDLMFSNMDYPEEDADFAALVDTEVTQQLQRLHRHPSLTVLCGNSEQEQQAAMWAAPRALWQPALFHRRLADHCARLAPEVPYWPSSAHGGAFPFRPDAGTCSYYGVGAYLRPLDDARGSGVRFASECLAIANVPSAATLARSRGSDEAHPYQSQWRAAERDFHAVRDHYVEQFTGLSVVQLQADDPVRCQALGRWVSGYLMAETFAQWRARGSVCGGGLVWFLRDLQPGAGWGLLDDRGTPKAAWHLLRRVLQPVMVALLDRGMNGIDIELVNEQGEPVDATLEVDAWHAGRAVVAQVRRALTLPPRSAQSLPLVAELDGFMDLGHAYRFGPPPCEVLLARLRDPQGNVIAEALHLPKHLAFERLPAIGLQAQCERAADGQAWLVVSAQACAVGVHIEADAWIPDDDFFHLAPGESRRVGLRPEPDRPAGGGLEVAALNTTQRCIVTTPHR
ncbi:MAG: glycoside hydrolase family 2 protein [Burkholderiales bacterium]